MTNLTQNRGPATDRLLLFDAALQTGNILINQNDYDSSLDRIYEVRGLSNLHVEIENSGQTEEGLIYRIENARKVVESITNLVDADFDEELKADTTVIAGALALGTVTCVSAIVGNTVTVNGLLYTAVAGVKANDTEFSIDTGDNATATDLADSIQNDTRTGTLNDLTATATTNVVTIKQTVAGVGGNATTLVSSGATLAVSGAVFTGGVDTIKSITDIEDISPESVAIRIRIKRETSNQNTTLAGITNFN